jgi:hypothetical protein
MSRRGLPIGPPPRPETLIDLPLDTQAVEAPFLRPRGRTRLRPRRRGLSHTLVLTLQATAVALLAVAGAWMGWQQVFASALLRVSRLEVSGSRFLSEGEVRELLGPAVGENILGLDIEELSERLRASPWVEGALVTRALPDTLRVEIRERVPLALAELDRLYLMDGDGGLIDLYGPRTGGFDLPIVRGLLGADEGSRRERARRAGGLLFDLAELGGEVSEVQVLDSGDLRVVLRGPGEVLLFGDPPYRERLVGFLGLRRELVERVPDAEHFDLRYRDRIYAKRPPGALGAEPETPSVVPVAAGPRPAGAAPAAAPAPAPGAPAAAPRGLLPVRHPAPPASSAALVARTTEPALQGAEVRAVAAFTQAGAANAGGSARAESETTRQGALAVTGGTNRPERD